MLTTIVLVLCFSCSPGNIVPTEERIRGATVYRAGFCQIYKSCHNIICLIPPCTIERNATNFLPSPIFIPSSACFFSSPPGASQEGFPASVPLDKHISSIYYIVTHIYFPFPRRKAPHHNPAYFFIDSLISASGGFLLQPLLPEVLSGGSSLIKVLDKTSLFFYYCVYGRE